MERRRHAPVGRLSRERSMEAGAGLGHLVRGRQRRARDGVLGSEGGRRRRGGFRWALSTILAALVGASAIGAVILGSADTRPGRPILRTTIDDQGPGADPVRVFRRQKSGIAWTSPKSDRSEMASGAASTRHIIHDSIKRRRGPREYIEQKPYARIVIRLANIEPDSDLKIPAFSPWRLYAPNPAAARGGSRDTAFATNDVSQRVVELIGGLLPEEDGQELDATEAADIAATSRQGLRPSFEPEGSERLPRNVAGRGTERGEVAIPPNTTVLNKGGGDGVDEALDDLEQREVMVLKPARGDTLSRLLSRAGAEPWMARALADAAREHLPDTPLPANHEVHVTLIPSPTQPDHKEIERYTVLIGGVEHKVTVHRDETGELVASASPTVPRAVTIDAGDTPSAPPTSSLYASLFTGGLQQGLSADLIMRVLRIHAYDTDYRRRVRSGDTLELFFDIEEDQGADSPLGELLASTLTVGGQESRFLRFKETDGQVDYFDTDGNNSRKFLMRKPVRSADVRFRSGYGIRRHPILNVRKMHTGVDWSAPTGTPIVAAGNGVVEEADRKGQYGNHVRIRHANGYKTTYSHMSRFAASTQVGIRVRQGEVIGYIGSTGLSSGPHLHFEVLINNSFVDPMRIEVPRERQLRGKELKTFQRERERIADLMRRQPVITKMAETRSR